MLMWIIVKLVFLINLVFEKIYIVSADVGEPIINDHQLANQWASVSSCSA